MLIADFSILCAATAQNKATLRFRTAIRRFKFSSAFRLSFMVLAERRPEAFRASAPDFCSSLRSVYSVDVRNRSRATIPLIPALLILGGAGFLTPVAHTSPQAAVKTAGQAPSTPAIFPLASVHAGLEGTAYTVFTGSQPQTMGVEVLGVLHNALGPHRDLILVRLKGPKPEYTGVAAGMSGSPVYIDGRLAGALAYRIGQFSKQPIAGVTPIAEMLGVGPANASPSTKASVSEQHQGSASVGSRSAAVGIDPIETPLVFSGFSPQAVKAFGARFRNLGLTPVAGLGGSELGVADNSSRPVSKNVQLKAGDAVSALLVDGDLEVAATCTATLVEAGQVLACGHPLTQFGKVSIPMAEANVVATLASPLNAFKIVNTGRIIGAFTEDRASAIRGVIGLPARMIPVTMSMVGQEDRRTLHIQVVDNPQITPSALMVSIYQSLLETNRYAAELTYQISGDVAIDGYPDLHLDSIVAPGSQFPSALLAAVAVGKKFDRIYGSAARLGHIESIHLKIEAASGRHSVIIERAQAIQPSAYPGDTVTIEASLRPFRGPMENLRIPVHLPSTLPPGPLRILLSGADVLDRLTNSNPAAVSPASLDSVIHQMNSEFPAGRLYVTLLLPNPQAVVDGRALPSVPISVANVLDPLRTNREMSLNGESAIPVTSVPVHAALTGQQVVSLDVE